MPFKVQRRTLADRVGVVGGSGVILLDDELPKQDFLGTGFGVKPMNKNVIKKLENLSVGKKRKNINFQV